MLIFAFVFILALVCVFVRTLLVYPLYPADYRLRQPDKRLAKLDLKTHNVSTTSKHFHAG